MSKKPKQMIIIEEIEIGKEEKRHFDKFIDALMQTIEKNQIITLPLKKRIIMVFDEKEKKQVPIPEYTVNVKKSVRIIEL